MTIVKKQTMKEQLYELIKERILSQKYKIGSKLNIARLSKEFLVSNTPIREALSMLEQDGLISFSPNYGYTVFTPSEEKIRELEEFMTILMTGGYEICRSKQITDKLILLLETALSAQKSAIASGDIMEISHTALDFDSSFFSLLDNKTILLKSKRILDQIFLIVLYSHIQDTNDTESKLQEHIEILNAVKEERHNDVTSLIISHYYRSIQIDV